MPNAHSVVRTGHGMVATNDIATTVCGNVYCIIRVGLLMILLAGVSIMAYPPH